MIRILSSLVLAAMLAGCSTSVAGGSGGSSTCSSISATCPSNPPSYATDVAPLLQTYCVSCHTAGGSQSDKPLDTYRGVEASSGDVGSELTGCDMPPHGEAQPTAAERETILAWITCGASDN